MSQKRQERFERFLMGEMPEEEQATFQASLGDDAALRQDFEAFKALFTAVEEAGLRAKLEDFHHAFDRNKENHEKRAIPLRVKLYYGMAASIAILMALGGYWFLIGSKKDARLFEEYYRPDPGLPTVMRTSDNNYDFDEAMVYYKHGDYEAALEKWEKLLLAKPQNDTLNYFLGNTYLALDKEEEGIKYFERTLGNANSSFLDETKFYLGMAHLKLGHEEIAKEYFKQSKSPMAIELLGKMNN